MASSEVTRLCNDTSEAVELLKTHGLFLKAISKINISVQLPQLKTMGKTISNWEVMEKLRSMIHPFEVVKSTLEFIRFEGELENRAIIKAILGRVDGKIIKLSGFSDSLKVRAAEAKLNFPTRFDWDTFFRDAKNMDEMKAGERPDTIHLKDLPSKWFINQQADDKDKPSELVLRRLFSQFGEIRVVDIPCLDPYRKEMILNKAGATGTTTFSFGQDLTFEAFVQFTEYIGFVKAMDAFRGMKLLFKADNGSAFTSNVKVDFDRTKHLSERKIRKREQERSRLETLEKEREERIKKEQEEKEQKEAREKRKRQAEEDEKERKIEEKKKKQEDRRKTREEKRRERRMARKQKEEERVMRLRIEMEERKILIAQRKLESIRLLSELFNRVKAQKQEEEVRQREVELEEVRQKQVLEAKKRKILEEKKRIADEKKKKEELDQQEKALREKILKNMRQITEQQAEEEREELRKKLSDKKTRLKSAVAATKQLHPS